MDNIVITDLTKQYGTEAVVDKLNLKISKGEIFGLLGPNGAGKTTTLMMLSTLIKPTSGSAIVNGFNILEQPAKVRKSIGMVFQDPSTDELLTGYENLKLHALMYDLPFKDIDKRIDAVLLLVDLVKRKNDVVKKYSGGMRRRLEIARGLLHNPEILFLDEPTLGLDPQTREHVWEYIDSLAREIGMTIVLTTHYMEEADKLCNRIAIIDNGKIVALDSPENLRHRIEGDVVVLEGENLNLEALKKLAFVKKIEQNNKQLQLAVQDSGKNLQELLLLAGDVSFVEVHPSDLNDVFLYFTGKEIREERGTYMERLRALTRAK